MIELRRKLGRFFVLFILGVLVLRLRVRVAARKLAERIGRRCAFCGEGRIRSYGASRSFCGRCWRGGLQGKVRSIVRGDLPL